MKKKMSNRAFKGIIIPIVCITSLNSISLTSIAVNMPTTIDMALGRGENVVKNDVSKAKWNTSYYQAKYKDVESAKEAGKSVALEIQDEGTILLKNDGVLPLSKKSKVMPMGYRFSNPIYGQMTSSGSGKWVDGEQVTPEKGLKNELEIVNDAITLTKNAEVEVVKEKEGTSSTGASSLLGGDNALYEYNGDQVYKNLKVQNNTTALVFIARPGQEGTDLKTDEYADGTKHQLALSTNELETIKAAKKSCNKVVLILESSAPMELGNVLAGEYEVNAILDIGHVGEYGFERLGKILTGEVNPSGRTVDIWSSDFTKDPSYANFGDYDYTNATVKSFSFGATNNKDENGNNLRKYTEYQEGIYYGYRYYETFSAIKSDYNYGTLDEKGHITNPGAVNFPFGYGLSYTSFNQSIVNYSINDDVVTIDVKVENTGDVEGKDVVQVYYTAPYKEYDKQNNIEKSTTVLAAFAKSEEIKPNDYDIVTLSFDIEDMASYSYMHENSDGTKGCYILEQGAYTIELKNNSHDVVESKTYNQDTTIVYEGSNLRKKDKNAQSKMDESGNILNEVADPSKNGTYTPVSNLFDDMTDYMLKESSLLSRKDFKELEMAPRSKALSVETLATAKYDKNAFDSSTDPELGTIKGSKVYQETAPTYEKGNLSLIDLRGKDYYDEDWDKLLNQIDWSGASATQFLNELNACAYYTPGLSDISLPQTRVEDGVNGIKGRSGTAYDMTKTTTYGMMPLWAATWNVDLIYRAGESIGQDSLTENCNGLYASAINLHRSPFGGRVFEYFSEDPLLTGKLAAAEVSGAASCGLYTTLKHFALNDQETNRSNQQSIWADEQTSREIYLKAFEIAVKEAKTTINYLDSNGNEKTRTMKASTGVMASQANLGFKPGHADYALLTSLLRDEWGFEGMVTTDYWVWASLSNTEDGNALRDAIYRSGCDAYLCMGLQAIININDKTSPTALHTFRRCVKNIAYTAVNSNVMNGIAPGAKVTVSTPTWKIGLVFFNIFNTAILGGGITWMVLRSKDEKKNPDKYKRKIKKLKNN